MPEPLAYLNGQLLPSSQAAVPLYDSGFVLGATITEQLRTFGGELFRLPEHLARLQTSLHTAGIHPQESMSDIADISQRIVAANKTLLDPADDLGLCIFITPGPYAAMAERITAGPTVCLHTYPLPFHLWSDRYQQGVILRTTPIQQVPPSCWPAALKCRSRMHYFLADQEAHRIEPGSRALLLDQKGLISEASTANVVVYFDSEGLVSPPILQVLPGISLQIVIELAGRLQISFTTRNLTVEEFSLAGEAFLTSTPNCLLPVTRFEGQPLGGGKPGKIYDRLIQSWNEFVGLDIAGQARRFANR